MLASILGVGGTAASADAEGAPFTNAAKAIAVKVTGKAAETLSKSPAAHIPREVVDVDLSDAQLASLKGTFATWKTEDGNPRALKLNVKHFVDGHVLNTKTSPEDAIEMMDRALAADSSVVHTKREGVAKFESKDAFPSPIGYTRTPKGGKPIVINKGDMVKAVAIVRQDDRGKLELYSAAYEKAHK